MMQTLYKVEGSQFRIEILETPKMQEFIETHSAALDSSFQQVKMSDAMRQRLQRSNYIFSGMKTFHELNEAFPSLIDENGNRKPFEQFLNDVQKIDRTYNHNYLRAEYNFCQASADMAAKWEGFMQDGDRYNLQYRTQRDKKVRPEHAALDRVTLPMSDTFWQEYYPPNGWNCRCTVVQVRKSKYPETPHDEAMALGEEATGKDTKGIFHFNPGIEQKTFPDYNPYTIKRCRDCDIAKGLAPDGSPVGNKLVFIPDNELCAACKLIHQCHDERRVEYQKYLNNPDYRDVLYDEKTGAIKATHRGHNEHHTNDLRRFFGNMTAEDLEKECQDQLYQWGHKVILRDEGALLHSENIKVALDMELDEKIMDIRSICEESESFTNALSAKNRQLGKWNHDATEETRTDAICLYFHDPAMFTRKKVESSVSRLKTFHKYDEEGNLTQEPIHIYIKSIYCTIKGLGMDVFDVEEERWK